MNFRFLHRTGIHFGRGRFKDLPRFCLRYGRKALLVTGSSSLERSGRLAGLLEGLKEAGVEPFHVVVEKEPDTELIDDMRGRITAADCVLAVGGGSVLDSGKALSALLTNPGSVTDYLAGLPQGGGNTPENPAKGMIAVPTTAGTGSEVTNNAVIQVQRWGVKRSMRSESMLPEVAVVDPELLQQAPSRVLASAAFDTFAHLLESWISRNSSPITDALAVEGLDRTLRFLRGILKGEIDSGTYDSMALAATLGGICLTNARLGAAHGLVSPLCGKTGIPHGEGVASLTPPAIRVNYQRLKETGDNAPGLLKLRKLAGMIEEGADVLKAVEILEGWRKQLGLADPSSYGLNESRVSEIAESPSGSMRTNPVDLDPDLRRRIVSSLP